MSRKDIFKRFVLSILLGLLIGVAINEISFIFLRETARAPKEVVLTIPEGTAALVANGEQPPTIPANMIFVVGDTLVVKNEDVVEHRLGPLWIPAHSSAQLPLGNVANLAFQCSFQPTQYFGLDVREPLTIGTRLSGILFSGLPMGMLIAVYSFVVPARKPKNASA